MALDLHRLLRGTDSRTGFRHEIQLTGEDDAILQGARHAVREELRAKFRAISDAEPLEKAFIVEHSARMRFTDADFRNLRLSPKFRSQGSYVYGTLNDPVPRNVPPQQIDLDDGMFVPTSFVKGQHPVIAAKAYFEAVEAALEPLCRRRGWLLCKDKSSCVRILVGTKIHIDLPLYAIPDDDFARVEAMAKASGANMMAMDAAVLLESEYQALPDDHIMLAERGGTWRKSDPRALERWFVAAVERHGECLRHVCRYLKAWRDFQWREPTEGIPSITLMAIAVAAFDETPESFSATREDRALQTVVAGMPAALGRLIVNPVVEGETLDGGWTQGKRTDFVEKASGLASCLDAAMAGNSPDAAIVRMRGQFGSRIPDEPLLVQLDEEATVLGVPRIYVAAPRVGRSVSG